MQIAPMTFTPVRAQKSDAMLKAIGAAQAQPQGGASALLSVASLVSTPVGLYAVGKAAFGNGEAGNVVKGIAGVGAAIGIYRGVAGLVSNRSADEINNALKEANGGRDLAPGDAEYLASKVNTRSHIASAAGLGNSIASGAAIATGNMAAGLVALALKAVDLGYGVYSTAQTLKDFQEVLQRQPAPAPPAPAQPAPAPQPAPAQP